MKGKNLAETTMGFLLPSPQSNGICIFLSHVKGDLKTAIDIGNYIQNAGYNIYLDKNDVTLQKAVAKEDPLKITKCIEEGITQSTHVLCIVSKATQNSWWVPYEIGYAKKADKKITSLTLKSIQENEIPDYLKIEEILRGTKSLNGYLKAIKEENANKIWDKLNFNLDENALNENALDDYLSTHQ